MITLQRNFEVISNLADDLKNEKNSLKDKLELLRQEGHANNASLNRQRELLHQDRLAFTHQRIAFDNHTMVGFSKFSSKNYEPFFQAFDPLLGQVEFLESKKIYLSPLSSSEVYMDLVNTSVIIIDNFLN